MTICPRSSKQCTDDACSGVGRCAASYGTEDTLDVCEGCNQLESQCSCFDDQDDPGPCYTCGGSGIYSTCPDDLCHGGECIHGDDDTCPDCGGDF